MAVVTVHSDFGAQENCFKFLPFYFSGSDGIGLHDLGFTNVEFTPSLSWSLLFPKTLPPTPHLGTFLHSKKWHIVPIVQQTLGIYVGLVPEHPPANTKILRCLSPFCEMVYCNGTSIFASKDMKGGLFLSFILFDSQHHSPPLISFPSIFHLIGTLMFPNTF